jgi:hypothetical protein
MPSITEVWVIYGVTAQNTQNPTDYSIDRSIDLQKYMTALLMKRCHQNTLRLAKIGDTGVHPQPSEPY